MTTFKEATISADTDVPIIRITRDFDATPEQLMRAHTDPDIFAQWVGPKSLQTRIDYWDSRTGGSFRFVQTHGDEEYGFHGSFHEIRPGRMVQTFTFEGEPDSVALETLTIEDLGNGRSRLRTQSLCDSFAARDAWLQSGMETGVNEGYEKLDALLPSL